MSEDDNKEPVFQVPGRSISVYCSEEGTIVTADFAEALDNCHVFDELLPSSSSEK